MKAIVGELLSDLIVKWMIQGFTILRSEISERFHSYANSLHSPPSPRRALKNYRILDIYTIRRKVGYF